MLIRLALRLGHSLALLLGVSALSFCLLSLAPGEFFDAARLNPRIAPETVARLRSAYGLSQPLPVRYARWAAAAVRGDLGVSLAYNQPVADLLRPRIRNTLLLSILSLVCGWTIALPLGIWSAARRGEWPDRLTSAATTLLLAIPELIAGTFLVYWAARTGRLPAGGMSFAGEGGPLDVLRHAVLPVLVLTAGALPLLVRHVKSAIAGAAGAPFVRSAVALGIPPRRVWFRHILPAAANALVSLFGLSVAGLLSASLLVETIFGWPGLGPIFVEAVLARDVFLMLGPVMLSAAILIAANLLADMLLYAVDPRIRIPVR